MTPAEMKLALTQHYGSPVMSLTEFCSAMHKWADVAGDYLVGSGYISKKEEIQSLFLAVSKSSLLGRMLYGGEDVRTVPCPDCKGVWRGCFQNCPCGGCGWLKNEADK